MKAGFGLGNVKGILVNVDQSNLLQMPEYLAVTEEMSSKLLQPWRPSGTHESEMNHSRGGEKQWKLVYEVADGFSLSAW